MNAHSLRDPRELLTFRTFYGPGAARQCLVSTTPTARLMGGANVSFSWTFIPTETGTVAKLGACTNVSDGTPPDAKIALVTLDADGWPTQTLVSPSTAAEDWIGTTNDFRWVNVTAVGGVLPTVTAGTAYAVRIWPGATPPDASNRFYGYRAKVLTTASHEFPRYVQTVSGLTTYDDTVWDQYAFMAVQLSSGTTFGLPANVNRTAPGTVANPALPISAAFGPTAVAPNPRKRGAYFVPPCTMEIDGFVGGMSQIADTAFKLQICDSNGTTELFSQQWADPSILSPGNSPLMTGNVPFASKFIIEKGHPYYLWVADVGGGANSYRTYYYSCPDAASVSAFEGAAGWQDAEIDANNVITLDNTRVPWMAFRVSRIYA